MARTPSTMLPLGTLAPDFRLPDFDGRMHALADFRDAPALLVAFICSHCPFVRHMRDAFAACAREYAPQGLAVVAINSNDLEAKLEDGPDGMREEAAELGYVFPYLFDE
jgi:peroxiredoxin